MVTQRTWSNLTIGLQNSGKTTFLAALWHVVNERDVPGALSLKNLEGDREYLNSIRKEWIAFRPVPRNLRGNEHYTIMTLVSKKNDVECELTIPDFSGESFDLYWEDRGWSREFDQFVADADGLMLFVHSEFVGEPVLIEESLTIMQALEEQQDQEIENQEIDSDSGDVEPWDGRKSPMQVKLVDLLQLIVDRRTGNSAVALAIIISAWDRVEATANGPVPDPDLWLRDRLPFLDQFITANPENFRSRAYGISAIGGDLDVDRAKLIDIPEPSQRILVVGHGVKNKNDITSPIQWLMET